MIKNNLINVHSFWHKFYIKVGFVSMANMSRLERRTGIPRHIIDKEQGKFYLDSDNILISF